MVHTCFTPSLFLNFSVVVKFLHVCDWFLHDLLDQIIIFTFVDFFYTFLQMFALRRDILPVRRLARRPTIGWEIPAGHLTEQHPQLTQSKDSSAHFSSSPLCAYAMYCITFKPWVHAFVHALQPIQL